MQSTGTPTGALAQERDAVLRAAVSPEAVRSVAGGGLGLAVGVAKVLGMRTDTVRAFAESGLAGADDAAQLDAAAHAPAPPTRDAHASAAGGRACYCAR